MRILVIEDEARILAFLARGLEAEGYTVSAAHDGRDGLRLALGGSFDLVVLDLLLPAVDGLAVLRRLTAERPDLPVLILSARADLKTKLHSFDLGARDYVSKPFALDELLARVRAQLRRGGIPDDGNLLRAGPLVLDVARREVRFDFDPGSNVVEVCVRRLRQKLGAGAPIETARNAGYRLAAV
jgi:DNA-binding response OmpR family regulator